MSLFVVTYMVLWVVVAVISLIALGVLGELQRLRAIGATTAPPLPLNSIAPVFSAVDLKRAQEINSKALTGRGHVLLFVTPRCGTCRELVAGLSGAGVHPLVMICRGTEGEARSFMEILDAETMVIADTRSEITQLYGIAASPTAVLVSHGRKIRGYGYPQTAEELKELWERVIVGTVVAAGG